MRINKESLSEKYENYLYIKYMYFLILIFLMIRNLKRLR